MSLTLLHHIKFLVIFTDITGKLRKRSEEVTALDRVERRITKRNEIELHKKKYANRFHEFATLGDYKEAMVDAYRKTKREQLDDDESTKN